MKKDRYFEGFSLFCKAFCIFTFSLVALHYSYVAYLELLPDVAVIMARVLGVFTLDFGVDTSQTVDFINDFKQNILWLLHY